MTSSVSRAAAMVSVLVVASPATDAAAEACRAESSAAVPQVVELYTSEGCSSCPPADRWLSTLRGRSDVIALGFHVGYWDRLGWPDRFASAEITARQHELARVLGLGTVYTPQVIVDGQDWRRWPGLPKHADARSAAPVLSLQRDGDAVMAEVRPQGGTEAGVARRWSGFWAVLEDRHESRVRAGENAGETLRHDLVVRLYRALPAWDAAAGLRARLEVSRGVPQHPRRVVFVVTDAATQRPLQALALGC